MFSFTVVMSRRLKLSGFEHKKKAAIKAVKYASVLAKTSKINSFFHQFCKLQKKTLL